MKGSCVLSHSQCDAVRLTSTRSQAIKQEASQANAINPLSFKISTAHEETHKGRRKRRRVHLQRTVLLRITDDCWQRSVQYVHVLHCHSNPVPVEESHTKCHKPFSCVLMSAPSGLHSAHLSGLTSNDRHTNTVMYSSLFCQLCSFSFKLI